MKLSKRDLEILNIVIRSYILNGEPIGSKTLKDSHNLGVSSATIRSSMSRLCEAGLLCQPHTSAGRIPTPHGYRMYIQQLISSCVLDERSKKIIDSVFPDTGDNPDALLDNACEALAHITGCVSLLTTPHSEGAVIHKIKSVPVGRYTSILMMITPTGMIKSKYCRFERKVNEEFLKKIDNMLSDALVNKPVELITPATIQSTLLNLGEDALYAVPAVSAAIELADELSKTSIKLKGQSNLFSHREFCSDKIIPLFDYLKNESRLHNMLSHTGGDITVILGSETGERALSHSGVIVAKYKLGDENAGAIGILGPDRMNYETIIPSVLYFKDSLGRYLTKKYTQDLQ